MTTASVIVTAGWSATSVPSVRTRAVVPATPPTPRNHSTEASRPSGPVRSRSIHPTIPAATVGTATIATRPGNATSFHCRATMPMTADAMSAAPR